MGRQDVVGLGASVVVPNCRLVSRGSGYPSGT